MVGYSPWGHKELDMTERTHSLTVYGNAFLRLTYYLPWGSPGGSVIKNLTDDARASGDMGLIPGSGRSPEEGNGNLLQYSCLENPTDRGALGTTAHGVPKSQTQLSRHAYIRPYKQIITSFFFSGAIQ